jgi:diaminopimelate decarboxylase
MSRFGVAAREEMIELVRAAGERPIGIHVHHGPVTATSAERFIASARAAIALLGEAGRAPAFVNLGGAWHGIADLRAAFAEVRVALGQIELLVEPGRTYTTGAGFATGRVLARRELVDRMLVIGELSRSCHLRWSQPELVALPPRAELRRKVLLVGPTCYEDDVIGEWIVEAASVERRIVLRNITGYAVAWNTGFGGVPPADVVMDDFS